MLHQIEAIFAFVFSVQGTNLMQHEAEGSLVIGRVVDLFGRESRNESSFIHIPDSYGVRSI
jgi:hypothetical protein